MSNRPELKFKKIKLCDLPYCYAVASNRIDGRLMYLFAPDGVGPCYGFDSETFERETLWETPGGTMSMVPIPETNGDFLAVREFNLDFEARDAEIVHLSKKMGEWRVTPVLNLPYVHRFDILERAGNRYLICCTVCSEKNDIDDWSSPGGIYAAALPRNYAAPVYLRRIAGELTRNHGYWRINTGSFDSGMVAADQGVFEIVPPLSQTEAWQVRHVFHQPVSDVAFCDIDGDGELEMATIEPFHGNRFVVYKKVNGQYQPVYHYPNKIDFCHVVWGGMLRGEPVIIGGCRANTRELFLLRWHKGKINHSLIETGMGPSNIHVIPGDERDIILVANREIGEGALFEVTSD